MHKRLLILGLLLRGPLTGYDLHRIVRAHGELYGDLKKANLYYLLERMAKEGLVVVTVLPGGRGPRRERLQYRLSAAGRTEMQGLLRAVLQSYEPTHSGLEVAIVLIGQLRAAEARELLEARLGAVRATRKKSAAELGPGEPSPARPATICSASSMPSWPGFGGHSAG
jgi:DNA-binding PadR family transcriptional regulator